MSIRKSSNLHIACQPEPADACIIAVSTPTAADKRADLCYVETAAQAIVPYLRLGNLVSLESTVSPHTTQGVLAPILGVGPGSAKRPVGNVFTGAGAARAYSGRVGGQRPSYRRSDPRGSSLINKCCKKTIVTKRG